MDARTRTELAETGRRKLEEYRRQKAAQAISSTASTVVNEGTTSSVPTQSTQPPPRKLLPTDALHVVASPQIPSPSSATASSSLGSDARLVSLPPKADPRLQVPSTAPSNDVPFIPADSSVIRGLQGALPVVPSAEPLQSHAESTSYTDSDVLVGGSKGPEGPETRSAMSDVLYRASPTVKHTNMVAEDKQGPVRPALLAFSSNLSSNGQHAEGTRTAKPIASDDVDGYVLQYPETSVANVPINGGKLEMDSLATVKTPHVGPTESTSLDATGRNLDPFYSKNKVGDASFDSNGIGTIGSQLATEAKDERPAKTESMLVTMAASRPRDFRELQRHIDDLTEEKFMLQRRLEQQAALAERLMADNEALAVQLNAATIAAEAAQRELEVRQGEVASARTAAASALNEREAYEMSARESADRAQTLAAEVVALEEKILRLKSDDLRRTAETLDTEGLLQELKSARHELARVAEERDGIRMALAHAHEELAAAQERNFKPIQHGHPGSAVGRKEASVQCEVTNQAALPSSMQAIATRTGRAIQTGSDPVLDGKTTGMDVPTQKNLHEHQEVRIQAPTSALIAATAMAEADAVQRGNSGGFVDRSVKSVLPKEIIALLPPDDEWMPGVEGLESSVRQVAERINALIDGLEAERAATAAVVCNQRAELASLRKDPGLDTSPAPIEYQS